MTPPQEPKTATDQNDIYVKFFVRSQFHQHEENTRNPKDMDPDAGKFEAGQLPIR
jgi:hypothetical protein